MSLSWDLKGGSSMTVPSTISHSLQLAQEWLKELRNNGGLADEQEAYAVLRAVLHQLRDRLTVEEAVDLGAQLPLIVRGIYYEGWQPHHVPEKVRSRQVFLDEVMTKLLPHRLPAEPAVRDAFALLAHHCDPGEIADVIDQLPEEIKELWPETARTYRRRKARSRCPPPQGPVEPRR
jgi:uncharacterized protein (DUF2267 family)